LAVVDLAEMGRQPPGWFRCEWTELPGVAVLARVDDIEGARLASGLDDAFALVAGRFFRREVRVRARACLAGAGPCFFIPSVGAIVVATVSIRRLEKEPQ
jgi:hypothetical protein